jgi:opacity protein-like surface antigen
MLVAAATLLPAAAAAQQGPIIEPRTITMTPFLGSGFAVSNDLDSSLALGAGIGYDLTRNLGFEGEFSRVFDVVGDNDNLDWSVMNFTASVLYHFDVPRVAPYAAFGIGLEHSNPDYDVIDPAALVIGSSNEIAWNFGGGVKVPLTERFLARADLRRFQANDLAPDYWRLYGGISFWLKR